MTFLQQLRAGWNACGLKRADRVLLGVSGGADSVALLRGTAEFADEMGLRIVVGHYNHRLRGAQSDEDETFATTLGWHFGDDVFRGSAPQSAKGSHVSEESSRDARYEFLKRTALEQDCRLVAVAHNESDQVETILHHILRGTGITGLRGIPRARPLAPDVQLVRPLLDVSRQTILRWLADCRQDFRTDPTNASAAYTRNRLRNDLLPQLAREYNPLIAEALLKLGRQVADADDAIRTLAARTLKSSLRIRSEYGNHCELDVADWHSLPRHLVRATFVLLWTQQDWPRKAMRFEMWDALADLALRGGPELIGQHSLNLPGRIQAVLKGDRVRIGRETPRSDERRTP